MRIAQLAPLVEAVPPKLYGGTERVVSWLTEELVDMGHEVALFASGDSTTNAALVACSSRSLRLDPGNHDPLLAYSAMLARLAELASRFDVVHSHLDWVHIPTPTARAVCYHFARPDRPASARWLFRGVLW
jgi:glycosyltransferase involved in cell wall biosynthesis